MWGKDRDGWTLESDPFQFQRPDVCIKGEYPRSMVMCFKQPAVRFIWTCCLKVQKTFVQYIEIHRDVYNVAITAVTLLTPNQE